MRPAEGASGTRGEAAAHPGGSPAGGVVFVLRGEADLAALEELDPERVPDEFRRGERAWILQTYLHLRRAGHPVRLAASPPAAGLAIFHAKQKREVFRLTTSPDVLLVAVRGDLRPVRSAAYEIVQCRRSQDGRRTFAVPHWTQPGLRPRDPARGARLERIAFKGFAENLHPALRGEAWRRALGVRGLTWVEDATGFLATGALAPLAWEVYTDVDAVMALRPRPVGQGRDKPASKLVNAWLAGVPAILGAEPAFRDLRRSELDYLEVATPEEALAALDRLRGEPGLYRAMVDNGRERVREFSREALVARWAELLFEVLPVRAVAAPRGGWGHAWRRLLARRAARAQTAAAAAPRGGA